MNILNVVCFVECISYLGTAWSFLKRSLLVFVLSIGMFLFSVPHSSLMMYTSVSRAFLSCFLFLAVIDTEARVIKTHQSRHYSTVICTELPDLSVNLSFI